MTDRRSEGERIERLFEEAVRRPPDQRRAFLEVACAGDALLRTEIEELLRAEEQAGDLMSWLTADEATGPGGGILQSLEPGRIIGAYQLQTKIGEGGMSVVYRAARADDRFRKRVAIKLVPPALASDEHLRRFRTERYILASLSHPNVARIYDAGTSDEGLPYFVMEYVEGEPIDAYCDRHRLSVRERLELFRTVCSAVHYAHQNLVVHRDLKPSNILVTEDGAPKLLDFGIAKLLNPELVSPNPLPTVTWHRLLTPHYASPEQVLGQAITTASDVYSLGVLLYKILTGRLPYDLGGKTPQEIERIVTDQDPERPSTAVFRSAADGREAGLEPEAVSRARNARPSELRRQLAGDLDNVVSMALRKEPRRRYGSAEQMAEDVRRHLRGLPVMARGNAFGYRLGKLLRRHRVGVAVSASLAALAASFVVLMAVQSERLARERDQYRLERDKSTQALAFIERMFEVADPGQSRGRDLAPQQIVEHGAKLLEGLKNQPEVQASIMNSLGLLYRNLGFYEPADELLRQALATRESTLGRDHQDTAESLNDLSLLLIDQGKLDEAARLLERALEIRTRSFGEAHAEVAESVNNIGLIHQNKGDYDTAETYLRRGLELNRRVFGKEHGYVALSLNNLATALAQGGDYPAAESAFREALEIQRRVYGPPHPEIARTLGNLAQVLRIRDELDAAEEMLREAVATQRDLVGDKHPDVALALNNLGDVLEAKGDYEAAETHLREALALSVELFGRRHRATGVCLYRLAKALHGKGAVAEAETSYREALEILRQTLPEDHHFTAHPRADLGRLFLDTGKVESALPWLREAIEIERRSFPDGHVDIAEAESLLGECLMRLGRFEEAEPLLVGGFPLIRENRGGRHRRTQRALGRIVELYDAWGRPAEAAEYRTLDAAPEPTPDSPP